MRFRETLWFKKGIAAEIEPLEDADDEVASDTTRPIEDRYGDEAVTAADTQTYGLHTGLTQGIRPFEPVESAGVPERQLIAELKQGRRVYLAMIAGFVMAVGSLAAFVA